MHTGQALAGLFEDALEVAGLRCQRWQRLSQWTVEQFLEGIRDNLRFYDLPKDWWDRVRTNNPLDSFIRAWRQRFRPIGCFHDEAAIEQAVF